MLTHLFLFALLPKRPYYFNYMVPSAMVESGKKNLRWIPLRLNWEQKLYSLHNSTFGISPLREEVWD
jgi:hypothetical protein